MARAKTWLGEIEHLDNRTRWAKLTVGQSHEMTGDGPGPGLHVDSTEDDCLTHTGSDCQPGAAPGT